MWHVLTEKRHTGPEERQGVTTQPGESEENQQSSGFQDKVWEEIQFSSQDSRARGQWQVQQRASSPRKADAKAELLI